MAKTLMIQGTSSNAGKSLISAGLCRIFSQDGYRVAPFKSQNMALNSYITEDGLEMGRAQVVQAEAAYRKPDVRMNPILLKPTSDRGSQVIVGGEVVGTMNAAEYYRSKSSYLPRILQDFRSLSEENDIVVIEGAGSPAEINLSQNDFVNMGMAKIAKAPVLIVGDIDRGGVFASLYGTYMLLDDEDRRYVKGNIVNKFRGDVSILNPGLRMLEEKIPIPFVGVVPMLDVTIDDEDSLSGVFSRFDREADLDIAVIRLPRISNFTDFSAFDIILGIPVRYVANAREFGNPDLVIIPGTKNTIGDLKWLRETGIEAKILKHATGGNPVFGICGGYQMLCSKLSDPHHVEEGGTIRGMGLFDAETVFEKEKTRTRVHGVFEHARGVFSSLNGKRFEGYEIHMGITSSGCGLSTIVSQNGETKSDGACENNVYGTYVHGIFDSEEILAEIARALFRKKGLEFRTSGISDLKSRKEKEYDKLADALREALDMKAIYGILEKGMK